jgi:hypothetical protein
MMPQEGGSFIGRVGQKNKSRGMMPRLLSLIGWGSRIRMPLSAARPSRQLASNQWNFARDWMVMRFDNAYCCFGKMQTKKMTVVLVFSSCILPLHSLWKKR